MNLQTGHDLTRARSEIRKRPRAVTSAKRRGAVGAD
jgi:hypothetical protein